MDFNPFSKKNGKNKDGDGEKPAAEPWKVDTRKAAKFFHHAEAVADSRQYDLAIEYYISGLKLEPDRHSRHLELYDVARRRKVNGGKPMTLGEKLKSKSGKHPIDRLLFAERAFSKDPLDHESALTMMEHALAATAHEADLDFSELAYWIGEIALDLAQRTKKPDKKHFVRLTEMFVQLERYDRAAEACRIAAALDPGSIDLFQRIKDLEAEQMMNEGKFGSGKEGGFQESVRDADRQRELAEGDMIVKTESIVEANIARAREAYQEEPENVDLLAKFVNALLAKKDEAAEQEAIDLLENAYRQSSQYKFKMQAGDIRMRQLRRQVRAAEQAFQTDASDANKQAAKQLRQRRDEWELEEFKERVKNYPTDMRVRYELGVRHFSLKQYDEAIGEFQKSQADPRHRAASYGYLGQCYIASEWLDEAIDAFNLGIEAHPTHDDKLGLELRYLLMNALEKSATQDKSPDKAQLAQKTASQILQTNINYSDIRERMNQIKTLVGELQQSDDS